MNDYKCTTQHRLRLALIWVLVVLISQPAYGAPGALDPTFGVGGKVTTDFSGSAADQIHAVLVQPDGKTIAVGTTGITGGDLDFALARYNYDGTLDTTFGIGGKVTTDFGTPTVPTADQAFGAVLQPDGKIVVVGETGPTGPSLNTNFAVARYLPNGTLDATFGTMVFDFGGSATDGDSAKAVALQADGKIVVAGTSTLPGMSGVFAVARFHHTGTIDNTFHGDGKRAVDFDPAMFDEAFAVAVQPDGKIVVAGRGGSGGGGALGFALARLTSSGDLDATFDVDGKVYTCILGSTMGAFAMALQPDGRIVAGGVIVWTGPPSAVDWALVRYNTDGSIDFTFGVAGAVLQNLGADDERIHEVLIDSAGRIVAAGRSNSDFRVVRYLPNGTPDLFFAPADFGPIDELNAAAITPDGKIVAGGRAQTGAPGTQDFALARWGTCDGVANASLQMADYGKFGEVCVGSFKDLNLTIYSTGTCPLVVTGLTKTGDPDEEFQLPASGYPFVIAPGNSAQVPIRFQPRVGPPPISRSAVITLNSNDESPPAEFVNVSGTVGAGDVVVSGSGAFGDVCSGASVDKSITVTNAGSCQLTVISAVVAGLGFSYVGPPAPITLGPSASTNLTVRFAPMAPPYGGRAGTLTIVTTDPDTPSSIVALSGNIPEPNMVVMPTALDFGPVCYGLEPEKTLVVQNQGACPLTVANAVVSCAPDPQTHYTVVSPSWPWTLAAGASGNITVKFTPKSLTAKNCTLNIFSNDPTPPPPVPVALTGSSITGTPSVGIIPPFLPEVIQSVGACQSGLPLPVTNNSACPVKITNVLVNGENAGDYAVSGLPAVPAPLNPGETFGTNLGILFRPTALDRDRLATAIVRYIPDPYNHLVTADITRPLCGEGVKTGVRVLVVNALGAPMPLVEKLQLLRAVGNVRRPDLVSVDQAKDLVPVTVTPTLPCPPFTFHREYGTIDNAVQLLPGSYKLTATAVVGGKRKSKTVGFDVATCDFHPTIIIKLE